VRRRLFLVTLAVTTVVVAAFALPLASLIAGVARDRAITAAERDIAAIAPTLSLTDDPGLLTTAIGRTTTGAAGRLSLWLADGSRLGDQTSSDPAADALARDRKQAFTQKVPDGVDVYGVVVTSAGTAVLRARIPSGQLDDGVGSAWTTLALVATALLLGAVLVADRLARSVTSPASELAGTARAFAAGQTSVRASLAGPSEISSIAVAFNQMADRVDELLAAERERVADLSHRLRTPLTALRLDVETTGSDALIADIDRLEAAVSQLISAARRPLRDELVAVCDLREVTRARADFWGALAEDDGRAWACEVPDQVVPIALDEEEAAAAFDVLLGNIFTHTPEGTPYEVALRLLPGHRVALVVGDAGPGFADAATAVGRGDSGARSTGLGLDIARQAATAAGGSLHLGRSRLGGAEVTLDLPIGT
jgi:signal transduction histidine kinase